MALANGVMPSPPDAFGLGLVLMLVGGFLLANTVFLRSPRELVREHFGGAGRRLVSIRGLIFQRLQVHLGLVFLLAGVALQLYGYYGGPADEGAPRSFPTPWVGAIAVAVIALELGGWWLAHALFLRCVREHFHDHPPALEADLALARELGDLFGIESDGEDSVQTYLSRIRRRLGLTVDPTPAPRRPRIEPPEPVEVDSEQV
jgi:hypothetical protein